MVQCFKASGIIAFFCSGSGALRVQFLYSVGLSKDLLSGSEKNLPGIPRPADLVFVADRT